MSKKTREVGEHSGRPGCLFCGVGRLRHTKLLHLAAAAFVAALFLPVAVQAGEPVWWSQVWATEGGRWALLASLAAASVWILVPQHALRPWLVLASVLGLSLGQAALLQSNGGQRQHLPGGLSHSVLLLAALGGATAVLARRPRSSARLLVVLMAAMVLLWPHPTGPLVESIFSAEAFSNPVTRTTLILTAAPLAIAAWALAWIRRAASMGTAAWCVVLVPALWVMIGLKLGIKEGGDATLMVAVKDALHYVSVATVLYVAFADLEWLPQKRRWSSWVAVAAACGVVMAAASSMRAAPSRAPDWNLEKAQPELHTLFAEVLPEMAMLADRRDWKGTQAQLDETTERAARLTRGLPALSSSIRDLSRDMMHPGDRRRHLEDTAERINNTLRISGQPFFVDLEVVAHRDRRGDVTWSTHLKTYGVERARKVQSERSEATSLWLARLDRLNLSEAQLGWTAHRTRHGVVVLGAVENFWRQDLAPALAGPVPGRLAAYARARTTLRTELEGALATRGVRAQEFDRLLRCSRRNQPGCARLRQRIEPVVLELISKKVESHELQHALDGMAPPAPAKLRKLMRGWTNADVMTASAELSAYLAELGRSPLPMLSKVHLQALAESRGHTIEATVWRLIAAELDPELPISQAALQAYENLFGVPAGNISVTSDLTS